MLQKLFQMTQCEAPLRFLFVVFTDVRNTDRASAAGTADQRELTACRRLLDYW
jgi:hypothetical protein